VLDLLIVAHSDLEQSATTLLRTKPKLTSISDGGASDKCGCQHSV